MIICPFCTQGYVLKAKVKATNELIKICEECDTVWVDDVRDDIATNLDDYMTERNLPPLWNELGVIEE